MGRSIDDRLSLLQNRRKGFDRPSTFILDSADAVVAKSYLTEEYGRRAPISKYTKYALGAMQEVDPEYTAISLREADRVKAHLDTSLNDVSISHSFELQGSVPGNMHIRGFSDVDLLVIDERFFSYDPDGMKARTGYYTVPYSGDPVTSLLQVRKTAEDTLDSKFPAATVDKTGSKSLKISGGSLKRPVDVVPANWYDTTHYQLSGLLRDRGIQIVDKVSTTRILNHPFRHLHLIDERDMTACGGLRKAIRLCKNVKEDSEGGQVPLSSYDIASTMWHCNMAALRVGRSSELAILAETQRHLDDLSRNPDRASRLIVPDGSRAIFDSQAKLAALRRLSIEMDDLMLEVAKEQSNRLAMPAIASHSWARENLQKSIVP